MSRELFMRGRSGGVDWTVNRRRSRSWAKVAGWILRGTLVAGVAVGAFFTLPSAAAKVRGLIARQETLTARQLVLEGNRLVGRGEVLAALGVDAGASLMTLDLADLAHRIEGIPAVRHARIRKEYPSALAVTIQERVPVMIAEGAPGMLVDEEGVAMGPETIAADPLPRADGLSFTGRRLADPSLAAMAVELRDASLAAGLGWPGIVSRLDFSDPGGPVALVGSGIQVRLGRGDFAGKMARLAAVLPQVAGSKLCLTHVDLRFERRVVVGTDPNGCKTSEKEQVSDGGQEG
jgi:cell division septal protein FtsQ